MSNTQALGCCIYLPTQLLFSTIKTATGLTALSFTLLLGGQGLVVAAYSTCSSNLSDADGDGWGWENNRSCVVAVGTAPTTMDVADNFGLPVCENASSDADGDGFGWEQDASCIITASSQATSSSNATNTAAPANAPANNSGSTNPTCLNAASDPDGDGYGWENNRSCVVTADSTHLSGNSGSENVPQIAITGSLKFMAVGDSITHGVAQDFATSYRYDFTKLLNSSDCQYSMVGSQQGNFRHQTFVSPHEGYNGHRADHFLTGLDDYAGNNTGVAVALHRYQPDLVLLHLGTNDMLQNQNVSDTVAEIDQIVSIILDAGADVLVANVIPVYGYGAQTRVEQLGNQLQNYVAQLANSRVQIVDVRSGFTKAMMLKDKLHPNAAGDAHIARAFFNAVQTTGKCLRP